LVVALWNSALAEKLWWSLTVTDYYERGGTRWLRFQEKRGKEHEVPVHSKAKEAVDLWLERSHLASNPSAPLFPSFGKNRETLNWRRLDRRSVLKLVEKRAKASGILKRVCCHSFRATGVTEYMNSGGTIEIAQRIAGHTSPATTRIYDRSGDQLTLAEIERVQIGNQALRTCWLLKALLRTATILARTRWEALIAIRRLPITSHPVWPVLLSFGTDSTSNHLSWNTLPKV
jgi:Phage integrase family